MKKSQAVDTASCDDNARICLKHALEWWQRECRGQENSETLRKNPLFSMTNRLDVEREEATINSSVSNWDHENTITRNRGARREVN